MSAGSEAERQLGKMANAEQLHYVSQEAKTQGDLQNVNPEVTSVPPTPTVFLTS